MFYQVIQMPQSGAEQQPVSPSLLLIPVIDSSSCNFKSKLLSPQCMQLGECVNPGFEKAFLSAMIDLSVLV